MQSPIITHLKELRYRIFVCLFSVVILSCASYTYYEFFYTLFSRPFMDINQDLSHQFYVKSVVEAVLIKLKFSVLFGLIFSFPVCLFHTLRFILPGLTKKETRCIVIALFASFVLAALSFNYGYFVLLPTSLKFLMSSHFVPQDVGILLTYSENIFLVFNIIAYLMIVFQLPIVLFFLLYLNIVTRSFLLRSSRYIIIGIFILSAIITPPDVISQLMLSLPLILLFFSVILLSVCFRVGKHV